MAARSRFTSEDEADEVLQMSHTKRQAGKMKALIYVVLVVVGTVVGFLAPFAMGAQTEPLYYPIWPLLVFLFAFLLIAAAIAMVLNYKMVNTAYDDFERKTLLKRYSNRSLIVLVIGVVFMVLFISLLFPANSWAEGVVEDSFGTYDQQVSGWSAGDFSFTANDPLDLTKASLRVEVVGNISVHIFVGEMDVFKSIEAENVTEVEGNSLPGAFDYDVTKFKYDGDGFEAGKSYVIRVYNYENIDDVDLKIYVHRDVSENLLWSLVGICVGFAAVGGTSFGLVTAAKGRKVEARRAAPAGRGRPGPRDAAAMFRDMEGEVDAMFATEGGGYREGRVPPAPGGARARPAPGAARPRPGADRVAPRRAPPTVSTAADVGARGTKKTISCPRCSTRFSFMKVDGEVTEIKCPNCGKRGRVGKKAAPAPAPAAPRPRPTPPRERPAARPARPAARPKPESKGAVSPLDEVMGAQAAAPKKMKTLACPGCKRKFQVEERPRPFKIECPHCGKAGMLK